jgi:hypothetical protein
MCQNKLVSDLNRRFRDIITISVIEKRQKYCLTCKLAVNTVDSLRQFRQIPFKIIVRHNMATGILWFKLTLLRSIMVVGRFL